MTSLIVYSGKFGTTQAAARALAEKMTQNKMQVRCEPVSSEPSLAGVELLIIGTPIYYGKWPKELMQFVQSHAGEMKKIKVLMFVTCLRLTQAMDRDFRFLDIYVDEGLQETPKPFSKMGMMEKGHCLSTYLDPVNSLLQEAEIVCLGFFKGNLDLSRLDWKSRLVMRLMCCLMNTVNAGDYLCRDTLCQWAMSQIAGNDIEAS